MAAPVGPGGLRREFETWVRPLLPSIGQVLLATLLLQAAALLFPIANQILVDHILLPRQRAWLLVLGLALLAALLAQTLLGYLRGRVLQGLQLRLDHHLMTRFLFHHLRLPLAYFQHTPAGEVFQRFRTVGQVTDLLAWRTTSEVLDLFLLLAYLVVMAFYSLKLTGLVLLQALFRIALILPLRNRLRRLAREEQRAREEASGSLLEILTSLETLQASGGQSAALAHYRKPLARRIAAKFHGRAVNLSVTRALTAVGGLSLAMNFWVGGLEVLQDRMTLGSLLTFMVLQRLFSEPLEGKVEALARFQVLGAGLERLDEGFLEPVEPQGDRSAPPLQGALQLDKVSFRFTPEGPWILRDLSLAIRPGEKVALVGLSGAGKSTLARLLLGIVPPTEGIVRLDGHDLRDLDPASFRSQIGVVLQDGFLFQESLRWNLALQHPSASAAELQEAAEAACIHPAIARLPLGYDQVLGQGGWAMSGGEQQRLMLARALVGPPRILLLDEATSALDLATEAEVHRRLGALGCTRVLVAHRLATVRDADRILVLEAGRILQEGTYDELAARPGRFQELVRAMEGLHG